MSGRYYRFIDKNIAPLKIEHLAVVVNGKKDASGISKSKQYKRKALTFTDGMAGNGARIARRGRCAACGVLTKIALESYCLLKVRNFKNAADARCAIPLHQGAHGGR